jgi:hypothetical protein
MHGQRPHLFQDLCLASNRGQVDGIGKGLDIKVKEIQVSVNDSNRRAHTIKIPNSLYLPMLRHCLLSPQHWAQEAGAWQTWMVNFAHECVLNWKRGEKTVPFNATANMPTFFTAPSSCAYPVFTSTLEALQVPYFCRETVLQFPGHRYTEDEPAHFPE